MEHTGKKHENPDKMTILKKHLRAGKGTVKVDISNLNCKQCQKELTDLEAAKRHLIDEHKLLFRDASLGLNAYNLKPRNSQFICHVCKKMFQTFILLNRHMNEHFSNAICDTCGKGFMTHKRLMHHKELHLAGGYPCEKCSKVYTTRTNLKYHQETAHEGTHTSRQLRCPHCPERFIEQFRKLRHLKDVHGIVFTYDCEICNTTFQSRRAYTTHTNKFHTQKTLCEICMKRFNCKSSLKRHMISHTGESNYVCSVCQKAYRHQKSLKDHMKVHANGAEAYATKF